jgi:hypothetical protein
MSRLPWRSPLMVWAARDLLRHPVPALLLFGAVASLTALVALVLLMTQTLSTAYARLTEEAPTVVVRRVSAGGWMPMPVAEALEAAGRVAGVIHPRVRTWGVVSGPEGPLTVVGVTPGQGRDGELPGGYAIPRPGQAVVGSGVAIDETEGRIHLVGRQPLTLAVIDRLPPSSSLAVHDGVLVHVEDARTLLGLGRDQASDLVLDVFHDEAVAALCPDLAAAFEWPVHITTRNDDLARGLSGITRRGSLALLACVPAFLAMALVAVAADLWGRRRRWEMGLFKALGWTGGDILRLTVFRGLVVGAPAAAAGTAAAYLMMFHPGMSWLAGMVFDWTGPAPAFYLTARGAWASLVLTALMVGLPFLAVVFWTGWQGAAADPADCVEGGR